jgi:DNA polymerase III subunit gamma/tau
VADTSGRALYLTWRPRRFDDVVGQHHVVRTIRNAVRNGTIAHAYLFSGPRGTGKTTIARLLFKAVNCLDSQDGAPCEQCAICTSANEGRAMDLVEMDAASNRGIDDVRELRDKINYAPADARYRVYILDEAHQLTQAAWDALLKTLEEPPPHAILVLATTEAQKVPATVLSRCQRFDFHRHSAADIRDRLARIAHDEGVEVEPVVLSWLARAARGGMRDAISLLDQLRSFTGERIDAESAREVLGLAGLETVRPFLEALQEDRPGDALEELNAALDRGVDLRVYVGDTVTYLRALMLLRYGAASTLRAELPDEEVDYLEEQATAWEALRLRQLVGGFGDALARFRDPTQLLIQIELAVLGGVDLPAGTMAPAARPSVPREPRPAEARPAVAFTPARAAAPRPAPAKSPAASPPVTSPSTPEPEPAPPPAPAMHEPAPSYATEPASPAPAAASEPPQRPPEDDWMPPDDDPDEAEVAAVSPPPDSKPTGSKPTGSVWDGLGAGGTKVRAHWDNDDADDGEVVRVVVEAPPPPPPPVRPPAVAASSNGHAAVASAPSAPAQAAPPLLDFEDLHQRWPSLRDEIWSNPIDRASFHSCELVGVEGRTLVIQMSSGNLRLLKDEKKRSIRGELIRLLGPGTDVAFIDDKAPYTPRVPTAMAAPASPPLPTSDPVIQAGLRYFGGPLERLPDE